MPRDQITPADLKTALPTAAAARPPRSSWRPINELQRYCAAVRIWEHRCEGVRRIATLEPHLLDDIGVTPKDLIRMQQNIAATRPSFWSLLKPELPRSRV